MTNHEAIVMAGLFPAKDAHSLEHKTCVDNLHFLTENLNLELLLPEHRVLAAAAQSYVEDTGGAGALTEQALYDLLKADHASSEITLKYIALYSQYAAAAVTQADFRFAVRRYKKGRHESEFEAALSEAFSILRAAEPVKVGKKQFKGVADAEQHLQNRLSGLGKLAGDDLPEGDFREGAHIVMQEYRERKNNPQSFVGVMCGIKTFDDATNGAQPGDLGLIGGYPGDGKTAMVVQWMQNAVVVQKKNVMVASIEVPYPQYRRRVALRHARGDKFGLPNGIDLTRFRQGLLSEKEEQLLEAALLDFESNRNYGRSYGFMVPSDAPFEWIAARVQRQNELWREIGGVHALFIDSLLIVDSAKYIENPRIAHAMNLRKAKQFAVQFNNHRGVAVVSPWQANKTTYKIACERGYYALDSFAETSEVEKSADFIKWLLRLPEKKGNHELISGLCKNREGPSDLINSLYEDFRSGYLGQADTQGSYGGGQGWESQEAKLY